MKRQGLGSISAKGESIYEDHFCPSKRQKGMVYGVDEKLLDGMNAFYRDTSACGSVKEVSKSFRIQKDVRCHLCCSSKIIDN